MNFILLIIIIITTDFELNCSMPTMPEQSLESGALIPWPITVTIAGAIMLLLLMLIVGGTVVIVYKKITRQRRIKNTDGQVKYISSEGGHLATEYGSENNSGFDNQVVSFCATSLITK